MLPRHHEPVLSCPAPVLTLRTLSIPSPFPMSQLQALVVGMDAMVFAPIHLLRRAGFEVDRLGPALRHRSAPLFRHHFPASTTEALLQAVGPALNTASYDLVVVANDATLRAIAESSLPEVLKQRLLPVVSPAHRTHLHSKIQLSVLLESAGIRTPRFRIVSNPAALLEATNPLRFPILIKVDSSAGGRGVYECHSTAELRKKAAQLTFPLLLQEKIEGEIIDLSGFYHRGRLVHFTCSRFDEFLDGPFGPSSVRTYTQTGSLDPQVFEELCALGKALGIHGFSSVTAVRSASDGQLYFFEADLRPNIWVDQGRFIGNDPADALRQCFMHGIFREGRPALNPSFPIQRVVPHPGRVSAWDLITNRHQVRSFIDDGSSLAHHLAAQPARWIAAIFKRLRWFIPSAAYARLRHLYGRHRTVT